MGYLADFDKDHMLREFIAELVDSASLAGDVDDAARKLLGEGVASLTADEHALLEEEACEAYRETCESCGQTPGWDDMLQTYDTGLCTPCFAKVVPATPPRPDSETADEECVIA